MRIDNKSIWQQAAGDKDRNYVHLCLEWDVILNGPGRYGYWPECTEALVKNGWTSRKITDLRRFSEEVADGDLVVLRLGTSEIHAVGEVVGDYEWHEAFGDMDGWDLQHVRRIRWLWKNGGTPREFRTYALKQGDTTQRLSRDATEVLDWLCSLEITENAWSRKLAALPAQEQEDRTTLEELSEYLFDEGVASSSIENLTGVIAELIRIAKWYQKFDNPSEFETIAYLVTPLLRALGWTPQRMAIEWNRVDVALFDKLPRRDENLSVVVEAKRRDNSCLTAKSQAEAYALNRQNCNRLIVTDGIRFGVYLKEGKKFSLHAYMNLTQLKDTYQIYRCAGAKQAVLAMTPEWSH